MVIVTDGLIGYWHCKQGFKGSVWDNIAPATKGRYNAIVTGAILQDDGVLFDGIDDFALVEQIVNDNPSIAIEVFYYHNIRGIGGNNSSSGAYPINIYKDTTFRLSSQKHNNDVYGYTDQTTGHSFGSMSGLVKILDFDRHQVMYQYNSVTGKKELYVNGKLDVSSTIVRNWKNKFDLRLACNHYNGANSAYTSAVYTCVRLYNRALTVQEIAQNYSVGADIGLDVAPPVSAPPTVSVISQSRSKLSSIPPMDILTLKFKFDQDITDWAVMVLGSDYSTGTIAGSGKSVAKDVEISVDITHRMLYQEGDNRINIYGRNKDGQWTPYN